MSQKLSVQLIYTPASQWSQSSQSRKRSQNGNKTRRPPAAAWRIDGADTMGWLEEVARWNVPHRLLRLLPLPVSARDRTPAAAIAMVLSEQSADADVRPSPSCVAYQAIGERLYMPMDAGLWPQVSDDELLQQLQSRIYVWDPHVGLIAFDEEPWLKVSDLLAVPHFSEHPWLTVDEGVLLAPRVLSIRAEMPPDVDDMIQDGQEDIGSKSDDAKALPRAPDESNPGALGAAQTQGKKLAAGAAKVASRMLPGGWAERLGAWADRQQADVSRTVDADQNSEVERLMKMLEDDPDEGLKYAPPLANDSMPRGEAAPSSQLTERNPTFSLGRISASGPGEAWSVSSGYYYKLKAQYREAANRELQLKRFRRAAYIFAELLGDHQAAAGALVSAGLHREAAALYQQKLNSPANAAKCLEKGGLLTEAIELYIEIKDYEKAGDLYSQLGQADAARVQYEAAVDQLRTREAPDRFDIARLLANKLDSPDEAMEELSEAWPDGVNALDCLVKWFQLASTHATPVARVLQQVERIADVNSRHVHASAQVLAMVARQAEDDLASKAARDGLHSLVTRHVLELPATRRPSLLQFLQQLAPDDRLLVRDSRNYLNRVAGKIAKPSIVTRAKDLPVVLRRIRLPDGNWSQLCVIGDVLLVAGVRGNSIVLLPVSWNGTDIKEGVIVQLWPECWVADDTQLLVSALGHRELVVVQPLGMAPLPPRSIRSDGKHHWVFAGATGGVSPNTLAVHRSINGITWLVNFQNDQVVLDGFRGDEPISSRVLIEDPSLQPPSYMPQVRADGSSAYVSWGAQLHVVVADSRQEVYHELPQEIRRLACSVPFSRTRIGLGFEMGGMLIWDQTLDYKMVAFADGMPDPEVCITRGGQLIAAGLKRIEVYSTTRSELNLVGELEDSELHPHGVISGPSSKQFAVLNRHNEVVFYSLP